MSQSMNERIDAFLRELHIDPTTVSEEKRLDIELEINMADRRSAAKSSSKRPSRITYTRVSDTLPHVDIMKTPDQMIAAWRLAKQLMKLNVPYARDDEEMKAKFRALCDELQLAAFAGRRNDPWDTFVYYADVHTGGYLGYVSRRVVVKTKG